MTCATQYESVTYVRKRVRARKGMTRTVNGCEEKARDPKSLNRCLKTAQHFNLCQLTRGGCLYTNLQCGKPCQKSFKLKLVIAFDLIVYMLCTTVKSSEIVLEIRMIHNSFRFKTKRQCSIHLIHFLCQQSLIKIIES